MFLEIRGYFEISVFEISRLENIQINMVYVYLNIFFGCAIIFHRHCWL